MNSPAKETPYTRTLRRAAEAMSGDEKLAQALGVTLEQLRLWSSGIEIPSISIFGAALDIVAAGRSASGREGNRALQAIPRHRLADALREFQPEMFRRAVEIAGDAGKLCRDLAIEPDSLQLWIDGLAAPPAHVFQAVIHLILQDDLARAARPRQRDPEGS